jgi:hypothetical protein
MKKNIDKILATIKDEVQSADMEGFIHALIQEILEGTDCLPKDSEQRVDGLINKMLGKKLPLTHDEVCQIHYLGVLRGIVCTQSAMASRRRAAQSSC